MARRKRSRSREDQKVSDNEIFPSCPNKPPNYCIYVHFPDKEEGLIAANFISGKAAKRFFEHFTEGQKYKWLKPLGCKDGRQQVELENGYRISANELEEIVELESEGFEFDADYHRRYIERNLPGYREQVRELKALKAVNVEASESPRRERVKKEKVKKPDGLVSVGQIAEELGVEAFDARQVLRKSKAEKPAWGWSWPPDEAKKIKALIKKGLK